MSDFTPGPWSFDEMHDSYCGNPYCTVDGCPEDHPSGVYELDGPDGIEMGERSNIIIADKANAALISAAPDLYEALKLFLGENDASQDIATEEIRHMARAALAKAGGNDG